MTESPETAVEQTTPQLLREGISQRDQELLREAGHRLLAHSSILRERNAERQLYDWAVEHQPWLEEWGELVGVKVVFQRDERMIMALPQIPALTKKLRREETIIALALWYDFDVEVRENGAHDVFFTVRQFNQELASKFPNISPVSASRLKEILRLFTRQNLIEMEWESDFTSSVIQVLPTLRFAIPFPSIEEWVRVRNFFTEGEGISPDPVVDEEGEEPKELSTSTAVEIVIPAEDEDETEEEA